jgi:hypothetical protein
LSYNILFSNYLTNSPLFLSLYNPSALLTGPKIFLRIFLPNLSNFCIIFSFSTQVSEAYVTTRLITAL